MSTITEAQFYKFVKKESDLSPELLDNPTITNYLYSEAGIPRKEGPVRRKLARAAAAALVEFYPNYATYPQLQGFR